MAAESRTAGSTGPEKAALVDLAAASRSYGEAALAGRGGEAEGIALDCLVAGSPVAVVYEAVIAPAMARIGDKWEAGELTIIDEHLASALNLKVMAAVYAMALAARPTTDAGRVVLAGVEGDRHGIGIRMAGDVLELAGFEVLYLGENVPTHQLVRSVSVNRPDLVTIAVPSVAAADAGTAAVAAIREAFADLPIVVGGPGAMSEAGFQDANRALNLRTLVETVGAAMPAVRDLEPPPPIRLEDATWRRREDGEASAADRFLEIAVDAAEAVRENARSAEAYRRLAFEDPLTGVANRRAFEKKVAALIERGRSGVLLMVDLDHFKEVNDRFGHLAGDRVLKSVAALLREAAGPDDFVARLGGDEFALLLATDSLTVARRRAEGFLQALREDGATTAVTATCGIARLAGDRRQALIAADLALYRGKSVGGDTVEAD
jgi:diguanylate cyclase (GGDEF)-like protein